MHPQDAVVHRIADVRMSASQRSSSDRSRSFASTYAEVRSPSLDLKTSSKISPLSLKSPCIDLQRQVQDTVVEVELEGAALRDGGVPKLLSAETLGVLVQYAGVGFLDAALQATIYPFLQNYLNASGTLVVTATALVQMPWSFQVFYGIISDCFPVCGFRRRPYMLAGWGVAVLMLFIMGCTPVGRPYWTNAADAALNPNTDPTAYTVAIARANQAAPDSAGKYVLLMMLCVCGYVFSDVCSDGLVVELAQREPESVRGRTQSAVYGVRTAFNIVGQLVVGTAMSSQVYGGDFTFSLGFPTLMLLFAFVLSLMIPATWFWIREATHEPVIFKNFIQDLWDLFKSRVGYTVICFCFFGNMLSVVSYTAASPIQRYLIGVKSFNNTVATAVSSFTYLLGIAVTAKWGLHWSWRRGIVVTGVLIILVLCSTVLIAIWGVCRSPWFWLGFPALANVLNGINFLMETFVIVELAGEGNESAVYGLLISVANLANPFAATLTKIIDSAWDFSNERIMGDSHSLHVDITYAIGAMFLTNVVSWFLVLALPRQKKETQTLKRHGGSNRFWGVLTLLYVVAAFLFCVATNLMGLFPSTSCFIIAGGNGCQ